MILENDPRKDIANAKVCLWGFNYLVNDPGEKKQLWKSHVMLLALWRYFLHTVVKPTWLPSPFTLYSEAQSEN